MYRREYESQRVRDKDYARHVAERVKPVNSANEFNVARAPCGIWADALDVVGDGELVVFFFQAEDGIRDADVTGVHTCALPISTRGRPRIERTGARPRSLPRSRISQVMSCGPRSKSSLKTSTSSWCRSKSSLVASSTSA